MTHVAAATGCPTLVIFTATDPRIWRPLGANVRIADARTNAENVQTLQAHVMRMKTRSE